MRATKECIEIERSTQCEKFINASMIILLVFFSSLLTAAQRVLCYYFVIPASNLFQKSKNITEEWRFHSKIRMLLVNAISLRAPIQSKPPFLVVITKVIFQKPLNRMISNLNLHSFLHTLFSLRDLRPFRY